MSHWISGGDQWQGLKDEVLGRSDGINMVEDAMQHGLSISLEWTVTIRSENCNRGRRRVTHLKFAIGDGAIDPEPDQRQRLNRWGRRFVR